jgi:hypothetical protein
MTEAIALLTPEEVAELRVVRQTKASPIRDALSALELNGAPLFVDCSEGAYKKTTIAQVVGRVNRDSPTTRLTVRSMVRPDGTPGLCVTRVERDPDEASKPKRGRQKGSGKKAKTTTSDEVLA